MKLLIASTNVHKVREIRVFLKQLPSLDILSLHDFPEYIQPEETGKTFQENAELKALDAAKKLNILTLADDSGLIVSALGNEPGVYSARYAGKDATDGENRKKLLQKMQDFRDDQREARFECCVALANPEGILKVCTGFCEGSITKEPAGSYGFGYDSIFLKKEYSKTFAEFDEEMKKRISHRSKALEKIVLTLESMESKNNGALSN